MKKYRLLILLIIIFYLISGFGRFDAIGLRFDVYKRIFDTIAQQRQQSQESDQQLLFAKYLEEIGVIIDAQENEFHLYDPLKREDAVVLICRAMNIDLEGFVPRYTQFKDVDMTEYYYSYLSYLSQKGMIDGITPTEFGVGRNMSADQFLKLVLQMLEYEVVFGVTDIVGQSRELGLLHNTQIESGSAPIRRGDAFTVLYNALFTNPSGKSDPFYRLADLTMPINMKELDIREIRVTNLREVNLDLNVPIHPVFKDVKFTVKNANLGKFQPRMSKDDNTLILFTGMNMKNNTVYHMEIDNLYAQNGTRLEKTMVSFKSADVKAPEVVEVNPIDHASVEVIFDEPISNPGVIEIVEAKDYGKKTPVIIEFMNLKSLQNGMIYEVKHLPITSETEYIMIFRGYKDYAAKTGVTVEKRIIFRQNVQ